MPNNSLALLFPDEMLKGTKTMGNKRKKTPYTERPDITKIKLNWNKVCGLLEREEWSSAILRAATASEIAANLAIREELQVKRNLESEFVDSLLLWANGIQGKFDHLLLPVTKGTPAHSKFKEIKKKVTEINKERNLVAHSGQFKKPSTAKKVALDAKEVIEMVVGEYHEGFRLKDIEKHLTSTSSRRRKLRG